MVCMQSNRCSPCIALHTAMKREENGTYKTLQSFLERVSCREVNKRAVENLIKAGALDGLDGNRQQMITVFSTIMDNLASEKKKSMSGQMTLL